MSLGFTQRPPFSGEYHSHLVQVYCPSRCFDRDLQRCCEVFLGIWGTLLGVEKDAMAIWPSRLGQLQRSFGKKGLQTNSWQRVGVLFAESYTMTTERKTLNLINT